MSRRSQPRGRRAAWFSKHCHGATSRAGEYKVYGYKGKQVRRPHPLRRMLRVSCGNSLPIPGWRRKKMYNLLAAARKIRAQFWKRFLALGPGKFRGEIKPLLCSEANPSETTFATIATCERSSALPRLEYRNPSRCRSIFEENRSARRMKTRALAQSGDSQFNNRQVRQFEMLFEEAPQ